MARPKSSDDRVRRVQTIVELRADGQWKMGITPEELAKKWHVDRHTVEQYHSEASRWLTAISDERLNSWRADIIARYEYYAGKAEKNKDIKTAVACYDRIAKMLGLDTPPLKAAEEPEATANLDDMTDAQLAAHLKGMVGELENRGGVQ